MKSREEIKQEIINLLPELNSEAHGAGNLAYASFTRVRGRIESLLWVLDMDTVVDVDKHTAQEDIKYLLHDDN